MLQVFAAAALGAAAGLLIGLSTSEVVGGVISALVALASSLVALSDAKLVPGVGAERSPADNGAVMLFAIALICGVLAGLHTRTHNTFSPTPGEIATQWKQAGFTDADARTIALYQLHGLQLAAGKVTASDSAGKNAAQSVLFSGDVSSTCASTNPENAPSVDEAKNSWALSEAPWPGLAKTLEDKDLESFRQVWKGLCE